MKIVCVGGGPAGLYLSILLRQHSNDFDVTVLEQNSPSQTYGWGVVYWQDLLEKLRQCDPESADAILSGSVRWTEQALAIRGNCFVHSGTGGYGLGRHRLLDILAKRAVGLGVNLRFQSRVEVDQQLPPADLVIACDGAGSMVRQRYAGQFGTSVTAGRNKYIWLGTTQIFSAFTFAMVESKAGWIWLHGYAFDNATSTCIVECSQQTWKGLGFDSIDPEQATTILATMFTEVLDGHKLMSGNSSWLDFRTVTNRNWTHNNIVLMGDAAHTTHFSIGSGTKLALEDAMVLAAKLSGGLSPELACEQYERERRAALLQSQSEAKFSALWFENVHRYVGSDGKQLLTLLRERRSPLLARIPPRIYYLLHQASRRSAAIGRLRSWIGPPARGVYDRYFS